MAATTAPAAFARPADLPPDVRAQAETLWGAATDTDDDALAALLGLGPGDGHDELTRCDVTGCDAWLWADCGATVRYETGRELTVCAQHAVPDDPGARIYPGAAPADASAPSGAPGWPSTTGESPAHEPIVVARKPLAGTVAANVLAHGTGALNIDGCRVEGDSRRLVERRPGGDVTGDVYARDAWSREHMHGSVAAGETSVGRWPANLVLTYSPDCDSRCVTGCPVAELDRQSGVRPSGGSPGGFSTNTGMRGNTFTRERTARDADTGGASRFFPVFRYEAKAPASERPRLADGTAWPTVKPVELMRWLVRLVIPPGGTVLDPFCGTGATGEAAIAEGFRCVLVEKDPVAAELAMVRLRKPIQPSLFGDLGAAS